MLATKACTEHPPLPSSRKWKAYCCVAVVQVWKLSSYMLQEFLLWKHFLEFFVFTFHHPIQVFCFCLFFFSLFTGTHHLYFLYKEFHWVLSAAAGTVDIIRSQCERNMRGRPVVHAVARRMSPSGTSPTSSRPTFARILLRTGELTVSQDSTFHLQVTSVHSNIELVCLSNFLFQEGVYSY